MRSFLLGAKTEVQDLPYDYAVEYLENSGTQWVSTGIVPTNLTTMSIDVTIVTNDGGGRGLCGVNVNGYGKNWKIASYNTTFWPQSNGGNYRDNGIVIGTKYHLEFGDSYSRDGIEMASGLRTSAFETGTIPVAVFGVSTGTKTVANISLNARVYSFSMTDAGVTVCDYVPCVKDGVPCFYDEVSKSFKYNAGEGDFIVGPRKEVA